MSDDLELSILPALQEQVKIALTLVTLAEQTGYLLLPRHVGPSNMEQTTIFAKNKAHQATRSYLAAFYGEWSEMRRRWPLIVHAAVQPAAHAGQPIRERCSHLWFTTPQILKWNVLNAGLHLLAGGGPKKGVPRWQQRQPKGALISCSAVANRYEYSANSIEASLAAFNLLDSPPVRDMLLSGPTLGRKSKKS